ncbi:MAG: RrF2 family transcriptional regulator [Planctomycetota bacterium]|jgi:Rrf2 family protein
MMLSQKCQYALRAVFELAKRQQQNPAPVKISDIAKAQAIPAKFLEAILNQIKQAGYLSSRRGKEGGYMLAKDADKISVGDIISLVEGPIVIVDCIGNNPGGMCKFEQDCVFFPMWERARLSLENIYNNTTFASLVKEDIEKSGESPAMYCI